MEFAYVATGVLVLGVIALFRLYSTTVKETRRAIELLKKSQSALDELNGRLDYIEDSQEEATANLNGYLNTARMHIRLYEHPESKEPVLEGIAFLRDSSRVAFYTVGLPDIEAYSASLANSIIEYKGKKAAEAEKLAATDDVLTETKGD